MKKLLAFLFLLSLPVAAKADLFDYSRDKAVTVNYIFNMAANSISTTTIIIDLSDTTNWPHKDTGAINIQSIRLDMDKAAASTTTVKIGVVNFVNSSTGTVTWFFSSGNSVNVSNTNNHEIYTVTDATIRTKLSKPAVATMDYVPTYLLSNDKTSASTSYQNDVSMVTPVGFAFPAVGDIVVDVNKTSAPAIAINITIVYFSEKP